MKFSRSDNTSQDNAKESFRSRFSAAANALRGIKHEPEPAVDNRPRSTRGGAAVTDDETVPITSGPVSPFDREAAGIPEDAKKNPKEKVMAFAEKHNWRFLGRLLQVLYRFGELQGGNVAAAVTLQLFLALFPLLIIASSVAGYFARGRQDELNKQIFDALAITDPNTQDIIAKALTTASKGAGLAAIIGFVSLLWSALGVASALQFAFNQTWQSTGRGVKDKAVGLGWMAGAGVIVVAAGAAAVVVGWLPPWAGILTTLLSIVLTFGLWIFTQMVLPNVKIGWRDVVPGAILATVGMEVIKQLARLVPGAVGGSDSSAYGAFGAALALIASLFIFGKIVVYAAVTNVVLYEGKHGTSTATIELPPVAVESALARSKSSD